MSSSHIKAIQARQILDSRGRPTIEAEVHTEGGIIARASAPSGASTGKAEAMELRDGGVAWEGRGVFGAVRNVTDRIAPLLRGFDVCDQHWLDDKMRVHDGTPNFANLGGNAVLAVSLAIARASAQQIGQPLYRRFAELAKAQPVMPLPMVNILSGGLHAGRGMDIQDFLVMPVGAQSYSEALEWICRVRTAATQICADRNIPTLLADEGGLSPGLETPEQALSMMVESIERSQLRPGEDCAIALDVASSSLVDDDGRYHFARLGAVYSSHDMIEAMVEWTRNFPIVSIEDGLGEDDWENWPELTRRLGHIQLVGDDLFATQPDRITRAVSIGAANSALIKVNQNGTVSGTLDAISAARRAGYSTVVSARSGETEDDFLADLAVGVAGLQIKIGSVRNSERQAKYNQLTRIAESGIDWAGKVGLSRS